MLLEFLLGDFGLLGKHCYPRCENYIYTICVYLCMILICIIVVIFKVGISMFPSGFFKKPHVILPSSQLLLYLYPPYPHNESFILFLVISLIQFVIFLLFPSMLFSTILDPNSTVLLSQFLQLRQDMYSCVNTWSYKPPVRENTNMCHSG